MSRRYTENFYRDITDGAARSGEVIAPLVLAATPIRSVADFGCGSGAWLSVWRRLGVPTVVGLDGPWIDRSALLIDESEFQRSDLTEPVRLGRRFDLVQCLEVAEHLPAWAADTLVDSLCRHSSLVMFSAAVPGQLGEHHINEQPLCYWRERFAARSYVCLDWIRPAIVGRAEVESWYRLNLLMFATEARLAELPAAVRASRIADGRPVPDFAPRWLRQVRRLTRYLPTGVVTVLAGAARRWASRT